LIFIATPAFAKPFKIIAFGTSFTAGKNVRSSEAFPSVLERILQQSNPEIRVLNYGVSGDTTEDLLDRISSIPNDTDLVILEYATGNDSRGDLTTSQTYQNLDKIFASLTARKTGIILIVRGRDQNAIQNRLRLAASTIKKYRPVIVKIEQPDSAILHDRDYWSHPTPEAHQAIARKLAPEVQRILK
jgi:acyl-CoA thioesterase-1